MKLGKFELDNVYCGDCEKLMKYIPSNKVDLIVTDPPYQLSSTSRARPDQTKEGSYGREVPFSRQQSRITKGFMGKEWDVLPPIEVWQECLRVLKPGAFAFIMTTPRQDVLMTQIQALSEAGFNTGFTSIYWTYACLSADTEVLTQEGWKSWEHLHKCDIILVYDKNKGTYKWEIPICWNSYQIKDTCYRIKSDYTDQLVSRNHRCLIEQEGKLLFKTPEETEKEGLENIIVPYLENLSELWQNISYMAISSKKRKKLWALLWNKLSSKSKYLQIFISKWKTYSFDVGRTKRKAKKSNDGFKKLGLERWCNLFQKTWELCSNKICQMSKRIYGYGSERRLCYGTSIIGGSTNWQSTFKNGSSSSFRPQSTKQFPKKFSIIHNQSISQTSRIRKTYQTTLATIQPEYYEGIIYCPTISTGCFVARRNGKIFLTGNSS